MARSSHQNIVHIVFSTKQRDPLITGDMEKDLHAYLGGIIRELKGVPLNINGTEDHVHILAHSPKTVTAADFMRTIKASSSLWVKSTFATSRLFAWQEGYGWFSVRKSNLTSVSEYIDRQKEHHQSRCFKDEFLRLLEKHEIEYDERFVWD